MLTNSIFFAMQKQMIENYCSILQVLQLEFRLKKQLGVDTFFWHEIADELGQALFLY